ncbi:MULTISPECIES: HK97 gp10 family phage protein [Bacillus cereus group]|uniref:HK97 gp10 family phage protein n=1 Tax=Bacillus cereus group TaxID=86661 RepID=UPI000BEC5F55|nr:MULTISPECIES: HK97 gp10 family phage protein [Bacillus cereus group]PDY50282.1 phage portal protein [Bacillus cereus]PDZ33738.1 phage portal protein [Bacillus toyonensis]PEI55363.1 phage portal protein [Bacillus toyonensis]PEJ12836.1 phage portal protein [Bacillus toyonensis]PGE75311.1 phage portal protein [Bacillus toyonensis]
MVSQITTRGFREFSAKLNRMANGLDQNVALWLEASGFQFLEEVQNQIISLAVVDTRLLLNSFTKGDGENVWRSSNGGLTLDVGTSVSYAKVVNDGHQQVRRFVPGRWEGHNFEYDPHAPNGMMLTAKFIEGRPYWDNAIAIYERMFQTAFDRKFRQWLHGG